MDIREDYKRKLMTAAEAVKMVEDGWRVGTPVAAGQPPSLVNALARRKDEFTHLEFSAVVDAYPNEMLLLGREPIMQDYSYCVVARPKIQDGTFTYTPTRLGEIPRFPEVGRHFHVAMLMVSPMDKHGYFSMGLSCDYAMPLSKIANKIFIQVNENMPRTFGRNFLHVSEVDAILEETVPLPALPQIPPTDTEKIIGEYIAELVDDGSCIQLGIGGIPNAVAPALINKKDLGIHSEMIADNMKYLWEKGVITNRRKNFMPDISVATFALGSQELYDWLDNNLAVHFYPTDFVNDPVVISKIDNMISINSALEVDVSGQVNAESIGPVQYTHVGGQADFVLGSVRSRGGKSIIAFESTYNTKQGLKSKLVTHLKPGSFITVPRYETQYVVTEYGVANIKYKTMRERVKLLINIAHPDFRDQLTFEAKQANFI